MFGRVVLDMIVVDGERSIILRSGTLRSRDANNTFTCMSFANTKFGNTSIISRETEKDSSIMHGQKSTPKQRKKMRKDSLLWCQKSKGTK